MFVRRRPRQQNLDRFVAELPCSCFGRSNEFRFDARGYGRRDAKGPVARVWGQRWHLGASAQEFQRDEYCCDVLVDPVYVCIRLGALGREWKRTRCGVECESGNLTDRPLRREGDARWRQELVHWEG